MFWQLVVVAISVGILYHKWQRRKLTRVAQEIPSHWKSYPLIGHAYLMAGNDQDRMEKFQEFGIHAIESGGVSKAWMFNKFCVGIADPAMSDAIYKTCLDKHEDVVRFIRMLIGNGSIFAPVNIWRPRRKILAPVFSMKNLNQFVKTFSAQSMVMTKLLKKHVGAGDFSLWTHLTNYTFDSVCETTLGVKMNVQSQPDNFFLGAFDRMLKTITERMCKPWLHPDLIFKSLPIYAEFISDRKILYEFVDELILNKRREMAAKKAEQEYDEERLMSFLELIIEQSGGGKGYSDLELREEVLVLLIAGTDTSAVGTGFAVVMLSRYPDIQEKVFRELQEVFDNSERPVTPEDLPKLKYLDVVIKETLRLYTPVPFTTREVHTDVKLPNGPTLVDGIIVLLHTWAIHRNPKYWGEDAEVFRPERFFEGFKHPLQFQPFSCSNRNCLGYNYATMSMKTVLASLLRRYKVLPPSTLDPSRLKEPLKVKYDIMMKDVDNYPVRLELRGSGTYHI